MPLPKPAQRLAALAPPRVAEYAAQWALAAVLDRHPGLIERLGDHALRCFAVQPTDLPFTFLVYPAEKRISVRRHLPRTPADVTISGPIVMLLALLEGKIDGDAVFFARRLQIAGDTEAILALRNALDDLELDLPEDLSARTGPMRPLAKWVCTRAREAALKTESQTWN